MTEKQRYWKLQSYLILSVLYTLHTYYLAEGLLRDIENDLVDILSLVPKVSDSEAGELQVSSHDPPNADPSPIGV